MEYFVGEPRICRLRSGPAGRCTDPGILWTRESIIFEREGKLEDWHLAEVLELE